MYLNCILFSTELLFISNNQLQNKWSRTLAAISPFNGFIRNSHEFNSTNAQWSKQLTFEVTSNEPSSILMDNLFIYFFLLFSFRIFRFMFWICRWHWENDEFSNVMLLITDSLMNWFRFYGNYLWIIKNSLMPESERGKEKDEIAIMYLGRVVTWNLNSEKFGWISDKESVWIYPNLCQLIFKKTISLNRP